MTVHCSLTPRNANRLPSSSVVPKTDGRTPRSQSPQVPTSAAVPAVAAASTRWFHKPSPYSWRKATSGSTCVARLGGDETGGHRRDQNSHPDSAERHRVGRRDLEEKRCQQSRRQQRARGAEQDAGEAKRQRLADHHPQHRLSASTECHANTDFVRPLRHGGRQDAGCADERKHQRQRGDDPQQPCLECRLGGRRSQHVVISAIDAAGWSSAQRREARHECLVWLAADHPSCARQRSCGLEGTGARPASRPRLPGGTLAPGRVASRPRPPR